ncbi:MAG TPA: hypothetical protein VF625_02390 [Longimicrobium sp.]|jgi:hypothetical protein
MTEPYVLEKAVWTDADFEEMGWHDVPIHATAYLSELDEIAFDIDYILKWVNPAAGETFYSFWIAPATLVFENVTDLRIDLEFFGNNITIQHLSRADMQPTRQGFIGPDAAWLWTLNCLEGAIQFRATGFRQTIRRVPQHHGGQRLDLADRGGITFSEHHDPSNV